MTAETAVSANPTYLEGGDPAFADYRPAWIGKLAADVTLEGSAMNGAVQGADVVRSIVTYIRSLYEQQEFKFAGPYGERGFVEDYTAKFGGETIGNVVLIKFNDAGEAQHVVANYRPRDALVHISQLIGDHFAGTPCGAYFATSPD